LDQAIKQKLAEIVGSDNFSDQLIDLIAFSKDASLNRSRPEAAVWVRSTDEVAKILHLANGEGIPVTVRGAGTSLSGTAVPLRGGILLDMERMDRIVRLDIEDRLAVVEPGVVYADLAAALDGHGFFFPPDPASGKVATLGGNVATNAGGIRGAKYGTTKDYVLALEVVLASGEVLRTGSSCMKSVSGFDLTRLFVGSEGLLGVVTEITLKINPKPTQTAAALATFDDVEDAGRAVAQIMHSGVVPSVLEIMDQRTLQVLNENTDLNLPDVAAMLLAETDGMTEEETAHQLDIIAGVFRKNHASQVREAHSPEEAAALWTARKSVYGVFTQIKNSLVVEDLSVPMSRVAEMLRAVGEISMKHRLDIPTVGHAGDGNLHPTICFNGDDPDEVERMHQAAAEIFERVIALEGTLTGEHGIGVDKAKFMPLEHDPVAMRYMRGLKRLFDPNNILNPGKMALEE
jgi:glycolate oxidase